MPGDLGSLISSRLMKMLSRYTWLLVFIWTLLLGASLTWNLVGQHDLVYQHALLIGRTAFQKEVLYRAWNSGHGGVYVPVSAGTPPNPYLDGYPGQVISGDNGIRYTLVNPAYMTRQAFELQRSYTGIIGHITSLKPVRPENSADAWESSALLAFEQGQTEVYAPVQMDDQPYFRYMSPLMVEERCLKCHAKQGYVVGQVRGGISESIPIVPLQESNKPVVFSLIVGHAAIWLVGLIGIIFAGSRIRASLHHQADSEKKLLHLSTHDPLTGLHNRVYFEETLRQIDELQQKPVGVLAADVDNLKTTNDRLGHAAGDRLIQRAAQVIHASLREGDTVARTGGDEFVAILPNAGDASKVGIMERLQSNLDKANQDTTQPPLRISFGFASTESLASLNAAITLADQRMYAEKAAHKHN